MELRYGTIKGFNLLLALKDSYIYLKPLSADWNTGIQSSADPLG